MSTAPNHLSPERARNRACGFKLLEISTSYETRNFGGELENLAPVMALVARARRQLKAAYLLTDSGLELEAAGARRAIVEYVLTLQWLFEDPIPRLMIWRHNDARLRLVMDDDTRTATGESGMTREARAATQALVDDLSTELRALRIDRPRMPSVQVLAGQGAFSYVTYRFDSQIGTHPSMMAAEQLVSREPDGSLQLHRDPPGGEFAQPDTYGVCAVSLARIFSMIEEIRQDPMTPMVDAGELERVIAELTGG